MNKFSFKSFLWLVLFSFFIQSFSVSAQNVVTSDDLSGGFIFRSSAKAVQKKVVQKVSSNIKRTTAKVVDTTKRIRKQTVTVAKTLPKRTKTNEVNPTVLTDKSINRKPKEEVSRIFAGAGEYFLSRDEVDKSVDIFREATILDDKNKEAKFGFSEALTRKADLLMEKDDSGTARSYYLEAIKYNANNAGAFAGLGEVYELMNETDKAFESYKKALALDSDLTEIYTPLGILFYQKGEIAEADIYLTKALATSADNAETQFFLGLVRFKQNKMSEAIMAFQKAIKIDPNFAEAYYYLGEVYDQSNLSNEAIAAYKEAIRINPKYSEAWFDLGVAYYNAGKYEDSISAYKQAVLIKNNFGEAYSNLGDVYREVKKFDEAIGAYRLATAFIKDDPDLYTNFGYVAARLALEPSRYTFWSMAIDNFKKANDLKKDFITYSNLGWAYLNSSIMDGLLKNKTEQTAKLEAARTVLQEAMRLNDKFPATYLNLGMVEADLGNNKTAIDLLKRATELRKDWIPALNELGNAYYRNNEFENAAKQYKRVLDQDENFPAAIFGLGMTEYNRKNLGEAKKAYQKLIKIKRNDLALRMLAETKGAVKN